MCHAQNHRALKNIPKASLPCQIPRFGWLLEFLRIGSSFQQWRCKHNGIRLVVNQLITVVFLTMLLANHKSPKFSSLPTPPLSCNLWTRDHCHLQALLEWDGIRHLQGHAEWNDGPKLGMNSVWKVLWLQFVHNFNGFDVEQWAANGL